MSGLVDQRSCINKSPIDISREMGVDKVFGTPPNKMKSFLEKYDIKYDVIYPEDIYEELSIGKKIICLQFIESFGEYYPHWVILQNISNGSASIVDPLIGYRVEKIQSVISSIKTKKFKFIPVCFLDFIIGNERVFSIE